jgi:hypothetical protein
MPSDKSAVSLWSKVHPSQPTNDARLRRLASLFPVGSKVRSKTGGSLMTVTVGNQPNEHGRLGSIGGNRIHYAGSAYRGEYGTNYIATVDSRGYKNGYPATDLEIVNEGPDLTEVKKAAAKFPRGTKVRQGFFGPLKTVILTSERTDDFGRTIPADRQFETASRNEGSPRAYISLRGPDGRTCGIPAAALTIVPQPDLAVVAADQKFPVGSKVRVLSVGGNTSPYAIAGRHIGTTRKVVDATSTSYVKDGVGGCFITRGKVRVRTVPVTSKGSGLDAMYFEATDLEPVREPVSLDQFGFGKQTTRDYVTFDLKFQVLTDKEIERIKTEARAQGRAEGREVGREEGRAQLRNAHREIGKARRKGYLDGKRDGQAAAEKRVREALTNLDPSGWVGR